MKRLEISARIAGVASLTAAWMVLSLVQSPGLYAGRTEDAGDDSETSEGEEPFAQRGAMSPRRAPAFPTCAADAVTCTQPISKEKVEKAVTDLEDVAGHISPDDKVFTKLLNICKEISETEAKQRQSLSALKNDLYFTLVGEQSSMDKKLAEAISHSKPERRASITKKSEPESSAEVMSQRAHQNNELFNDRAKWNTQVQLLKEAKPHLESLVSHSKILEESLSPERCSAMIESARAEGKNLVQPVHQMMNVISNYIKETMSAYDSYYQLWETYLSKGKALNPKYSEFAASLKAKRKSKDSFDTLAVKPIQRLPRFGLYLGEFQKLEKYIPDEPTKTQIHSLQHYIQNSLHQMEENAKKTEQGH